MKNREFLSGILGFGLLTIFGVGLFLIIRWLVEKVSTLQSQTSSAIIAGAVAIVLAVMSHAVQLYLTRKRETEEAQRPAKIELYETFMEHWFDAMNNVRTAFGQDRPAQIDEETLQAQHKIMQRMILWGSDEVTIAYRRFWRALLRVEEPDDMEELMARLEDLLFAFRHDLGHRNKGLDRADLLSLFINDIEKMDLSRFPRPRQKTSVAQ